MCVYTMKHIQPVPECTGVLNEVDAETTDGGLNKTVDKRKYANEWKYTIDWSHVIQLLYVHLGAVKGVYLMFTSGSIYTTIFAFTLYLITGLGITAGAHRLWTHHSYKAKLPLQILLLVFNTMAHQYSVIRWSRDHRVHHKYSETDADPYNATRGFFFSHMGWLMCKKHPEVIAKGKGMDMSDLENDPLLRFQKRYYTILAISMGFILPTLIPVYLWNESWSNAWYIAVTLRWVFTTNITFSINSVAHMFGNHPYDKYINPVENKSLAVLALGEGWHNYHHTFPWDYKTGELGSYRTNFTTLFIDCMTKIGWAYDLKTVSPEMIERRVKRTGDGSHQTCHQDESNIEPTNLL